MSEYDGTDEIEIEGGFFEEAGVEGNDVPDDPFGFGNEFWPLYVVEVGKPKVTKNKDKIGMMVKFAVDHEKYRGKRVSESLGNGNWYRLPVPLPIRSQIPWNPEGEDEQSAIFKLGQLYGALGFSKDQYKKVNGALMKDKRFLAKIRVTQDEQGFWKFNIQNMKPIGEGSDAGMGQFSQSASSNPNAGLSAAEQLKKEMEEA